MWRMKSVLLMALVLGASMLAAPVASAADELVVKSCQDLMAMAEAYQQDLKTIETVLGSAIDGGDMERIRSFKLKPAAVKKKLDLVLKAIEVKECVKPR
jgi:hypothetical protein